MARPRKYNISLTDDEVKKLKSIMHKKQTSKTVRNRCQIILDLDEAKDEFIKSYTDKVVSAFDEFTTRPQWSRTESWNLMSEIPEMIQ